MARRPDADLIVDERLVRDLLVQQHPDLAGLPLRLENSGWDNSVYRLGDELLLRIPRREAAAHLIEHEQRWLPELASRLPVRVPNPVRVGRPSEAFPWSWTIAPWLPGESAALIAPERRASAAEALAAFMLALHQPAPADAPGNPYRGVPLSTRDAVVLARLDTLRVPPGHGLRTLWSSAVAAPQYSGPPMWLHGDLHPANLLMAEAGLTAVIDFGDLTAGDPATDLAAAWLVFDPAGRSRFRAALETSSELDRSVWMRARGWALVLGTALAAHADDDPVLGAIGDHTLTQLRED